GTEHLFIAISKIKNGATVNLLKRAGLSPLTVRNEIRKEIGTGDNSKPLNDVLPITPRGEIVLSLAIFLAEQEDRDEIDESHLLLALLQEGEGVAVRKLIDLGFDLNLWLQRLLLEAQDQHMDSAHDSDNQPFLNFNFSDDLDFEDSNDGESRGIPTPL